MNDTPIAALAIAEQARKTFYPAPFASVVAGRTKRRVGDHFGLAHFGVNLTQLAPGAASALLLGTAEFLVQAGDCCGFKAGTGEAHRLVNRSDTPVTYLEIGNRAPDDLVEYPNDDLKIGVAADGRRIAVHKDGTPY